MPVIFPVTPLDWEDLEVKVCQIFKEAGCRAFRGKTLKTVRGSANVDVVVQDATRRPHALILCECKSWNRNVDRNTVLSFRTVVQDSGATLGFLISETGFQPGAIAAAQKSNIRLVTWKAFQREIYGRWFEAQERRLVDLADDIFELRDSGAEDHHCPTLMSEAISNGGEQAWQESELLNRRYFQLAFASSHIAGGAIRRFPFQGIDPRTPTGATITYKAARMYFDILFEAWPQAVSDYIDFLRNHTGGRCGSHGLFNAEVVGQIREGRTTMKELRNLIPNQHGGIQVVPTGEIWTFRGSISRFQKPRKTRFGWTWKRPMTTYRTLVVQFGPDQIALRVDLEESANIGPPRP